MIWQPEPGELVGLSPDPDGVPSLVGLVLGCEPGGGVAVYWSNGTMAGVVDSLGRWAFPIPDDERGEHG